MVSWPLVFSISYELSSASFVPLPLYWCPIMSFTSLRPLAGNKAGAVYVPHVHDMEIPILFLFQRLKPTNPAAQKALTTPTHYKLTPRPATRVRPKALQSAGSAKSQLFDGLDDDEPSLSNGAFMPKLVFLFCTLGGGGAGKTGAWPQF